jgi:hypothetical protein|tara:strand:+ start:102 stop:350 length:249 start_codon:yes stop_codon:yes gene_type:complete
MKLDVIFKVQSIIDERAIPVDILELLDTTYYSKSKDRDIRLGDMDITHFVRVYSNLKDTDNVSIADKLDKVRLQLTDIENQI